MVSCTYVANFCVKPTSSSVFAAGVNDSVIASVTSSSHAAFWAPQHVERSPGRPAQPGGHTCHVLREPGCDLIDAQLMLRGYVVFSACARVEVQLGTTHRLRVSAGSVAALGMQRPSMLVVR